MEQSGCESGAGMRLKDAAASPGLTTAEKNKEKTMLIRVLTLRFSPLFDGFDDTQLTEFIKDKSVVSLREYFFIRNEIPYLAVVVLYEPVKQTESVQAKKGKEFTENKRDESWRSLLTYEQMPMFDTLRSWRSERCKQEGVPPYVICNNKQLARIVNSSPQSLAALLKIEGIGKGKVEKYGDEIIEILQRNIKHEQLAFNQQEKQ